MKRRRRLGVVVDRSEGGMIGGGRIKEESEEGCER